MELNNRQKKILTEMQTRKPDAFHSTDNRSKHYQEQLLGAGDYIAGFDDGEGPIDYRE